MCSAVTPAPATSWATWPAAPSRSGSPPAAARTSGCSPPTATAERAAFTRPTAPGPRRSRAPARPARAPGPRRSHARARGPLAPRPRRSRARGPAARCAHPRRSRRVLTARSSSSSVWGEPNLHRQYTAGHDEALDVRRALLDLLELGVAHPLLDRVLARVAPAAERLHGRPRAEHGGLGGVELRHRGLGRRPAARVEQARGAPGEQTRGVDAHRHVGEPEGDGLVLGDRAAELNALLGVVAGVLERGAGEAGRGGGERDARAVEDLHEAAEALALRPQPPVVGDEAVGEEQLGVDDRALAHLAHRPAERDARVVAMHEERRDAAVAAAALDGREDDVALRDAAVRDPGLLAVEQVAAVDPLRRRLDRRGVRAGVRLGRRERGHRRRLARQRADPLLLLLLGAEREHRLGEEAVARDEVPDARAAVAELLLHDTPRQDVGHPAAAELLGEHERGQPERRRLVEDLPGRLDVRLVDLQRDRPDLARGKLAADAADLVLLGGEVEGGRGVGGGHGPHRTCRPAPAPARAGKARSRDLSAGGFLAQAAGERLQQRPRDGRVLLHEAPEVPRGHAEAAQLRVGGDGGGALVAVQQRHLAVVLAGPERADDAIADAHDRLALDDDEEADAAPTLDDDLLAGRERPLVQGLRQPLAVALRELGEQRDPLEGLEGRRFACGHWRSSPWRVGECAADARSAATRSIATRPRAVRVCAGAAARGPATPARRPRTPRARRTRPRPRASPRCGAPSTSPTRTSSPTPSDRRARPRARRARPRRPRPLARAWPARAGGSSTAPAPALRRCPTPPSTARARAWRRCRTPPWAASRPSASAPAAPAAAPTSATRRAPCAPRAAARTRPIRRRRSSARSPRSRPCASRPRRAARGRA